MQGWRDPVGSEATRVYWVRRVLVIVALVAVVALVVALLAWLVGGKNPGAAQTPTAGQPTAGQPSVAHTPAPSSAAGQAPTSPAPATKASSAAPSASSATPTGSGACAPEQLQARISSDNASIKSGDSTTLHIAVKNAGDKPCVAAISPQQGQLTISSGDVKIWSTADCGAWFGHDETATLDPGASVEWDIDWGTKKSTGSCDDNHDQLAPGTYVARFALGDVKASYVMVLHD